jgi:hypothetical protein
MEYGCGITGELVSKCKPVFRKVYDRYIGLKGQRDMCVSTKSLLELIAQFLVKGKVVSVLVPGAGDGREYVQKGLLICDFSMK